MDTETSSTLRFFHYIPSKPLGIVGLIVFIVIALFLFIRIFRSKSRLFLYILPCTAVAECIGYLIRALCSSGETTMGKYIIMTMFLLLSPNALALVNYKALGEVIKLSNIEKAPFYLRPKFVTWFFFSSDIFSFLLQGSGGGMQTTPANANLGKQITLVGLAIQLVFFAAFILITVHVHRSPKYDYSIEGQPNAKRNMMRCLYITLILLYVRSIYRIAEYATGYDGAIARAEWAFYVFDGLAIAISFVFYSVLFMGNYLPKRNEVNGGGLVKRLSSESTSVDNLTHIDNGFEMRQTRDKYSSNNV
ncbi:hypothetical protein INT47_008085 [Mucor saturninus]|uniref:Uncharacterized protein n=1 Tax=Mucor saturninus TaxID=64648 RepID=A0A8H7R0Q1_9FUNG|nr:hypothetical protein INT47_008085 [Mucor saturninus]